MLLLHLQNPLFNILSINLLLLKQLIHSLLGLILKPLIKLPILKSHFVTLLKSHFFDPLSLTLGIFLIINFEIIFDEIFIFDLHPDLLFLLHYFLFNLLQPGDLSIPYLFDILQRVLAIHKIYKKYKNYLFVIDLKTWFSRCCLLVKDLLTALTLRLAEVSFIFPLLVSYLNFWI
jgi:hypothetical protein